LLNLCPNLTNKKIVQKIKLVESIAMQYNRRCKRQRYGEWNISAIINTRKALIQKGK
jgi:hypothetical protein